MVVSVLAIAVTPYGAAIYIEIIRTLGDRSLHGRISEWQSLAFSIEVALLAAVWATCRYSEAALGGREGADGPLCPVPGADPLDEGRHLGPVGTDVLDRDGPHGPGYPGEGFHPGPLGGHGPSKIGRASCRERV